MHILCLTICICILSWICALDPSWPSSYLSIPFTSVPNPGNRQNLINVEINRYPYVVDISIHTRTQYFLSINEMAVRKEMKDRPDYRKHEDNVFGLVEFIGVELPDQRLEAKRRLTYYLYYYARNILPRLAWFNMESIKQIPTKERPSRNCEGSFDFGPTASNNPVIKDLKRFNEYMKYHIVTFKLGQQRQGELFLGGFPVTELADGAVFASVKLDKQGNYWRILTQSLSIKWKKQKNIEQYFLVKEMVKFRLTISSPLLILPRVTADGLERTFPQCKFQQDSLSPRKLLTCRNMDSQKINALQFEIIVANSAIPLTLKVAHLIRSFSPNQTVFQISTGEDDELQIGATLLEQFLFGIDYREGMLHYGRKGEQGWLNRFILFKAIIIFNALALMVSLVVIAFEKKLRVQVVAAVKEESEIYRPRASGYQMAEISQETIIE